MKAGEKDYKCEFSKIDYISAKLLPVLIFITEYISILLAQKISIFIQHNLPFTNGLFYISDLYFYVIIPLVFIFFLYYTKVNERFILYWETLQRTFYAVMYGEIFCVVLLYLFKSSNYVSRTYVMIFFIMVFLCLCISRQMMIKICRKLNLMKEIVVFIGAGKTTEKIIEFTRNNNCFGIKIAGILEDGAEKKICADKYYMFQNLQELKDYVERFKIRTVIIAVPDMQKERLLDLIEDLQPVVRNLMFVPNIVGMPVFNLEVKRLYENNMVLLGIKNNLAKKTNRRIKRVFDIVFSLATMVIILPVSIIVMIGIMIESPGASPIFKHYRVGKGGKLFPCYKFRSMVPNAQEKLKAYLQKNPEAQQEWQANFKLKNDPRITKIGKFIRKTSIDELPQFINVLKGEMSWVGPRPIIKDEVHYYGKNIQDYYSVLPGITGMWQVNGRSETSYDERVKLDVWYIRNWSVWIDIVLLIKTFKVVINRKGAV